MGIVGIADAGSPPGRGMDGSAHAGTLSFEMSAAHERLVVNCGIYPGAPREWRQFMRYTAAHSTAVVDDTNSTEITDHGALEYRAGNVLVDRAEDQGAQWLDMSHDGYRSLFGIIHRRRLWLSPDGGDLRGEDLFTGPEGRPVTVPDLYATLLSAFGLDAGKVYHTPSGWPVRLADKGKDWLFNRK